ncbi:ferritin-like domain-containing protein [Peribacillus sp. NPDC097264]|uniref:ferritin-like domain-containing protein n=1 Tax=Peribacillus sp. NPDC097264 TaxID=3390616 RepID=UPI003D03A51E
MYDYIANDQEENRQQDLIHKLEQTINGEYSAILCYEKLARMAPNETERKQILEIREDEMKHFQVFSQIYINLTGYQPTPKVTETCPDSYKAGLEFALVDEQKTVDFYLETADGAADRSVRKAFRRAAADEQNHAVWFLYYMVKNK